jgi:branched-subunit amino acid aminotransferase/4-amino-4-deoxychorismate lyase
MELNGGPVNLKDISSLTLYNYGNCSTMLVTQEGVRGLRLHLDRLNRDSQVLFGTGIDHDNIKHLIKHAVKNVQKPIAVRVTVFYKDFDLTKPVSQGKPDILITTRSAPSQTLPALSLKPMIYQRDLPAVKSVAVGSNLYRRHQAQLDGFDDALFVTLNEEISEGPSWNIIFLQGDKVIFPTTSNLPGVSIALLQQALSSQGVPTEARTIRLSEMPTMNGAVAASAVSGFRGVTSIAGKTFVSDQALEMLQKVYEATPYEEL